MESVVGSTIVEDSLVQPPQPRMRRQHRPRKDWHAISTVFDSLDDLKTALRQYMDSAISEDGLPQYVSCAMTLSPHALLHLKLDNPFRTRKHKDKDAVAEQGDEERDGEADGQGQGQGQGQDNVYKSVLELVNIGELKQRQTWQRAAAKGVVYQIQALDGFKYCFNNNWTSKDDNGYRYSYTCLDSLENKDRHANGFRPTSAATRKPNANSRGVRKPTYDCKGQIAVKFSGNRQVVEVVYKHHAIHKTVAERRPPPRKDARRKAAAATATGATQSQAEASPGSMQPSFVDIDPQDAPFMFDHADAADFQAYSEPVEASPVEPPQAKKKTPRKPKDSKQPRKKRQKTQQSQSAQPAQPAQAMQHVQLTSDHQQDRPLSLAEILQQSMAPNVSPRIASAAHASQQSSVPVAPTRVYNSQDNQFTFHQEYNHSVQQDQPQDVGRFSKLPVPCFKCKASHTECDGQPVCNSCTLRGTVCSYPSILRFDKTPVPHKRWIQEQSTPPTQYTQPRHPGRSVFRINMNQAPTAAPQTNNQFGQQHSWYSHQQ